MELSASNYYSAEANREYMSVSQYKDFAGTYGKLGCEYCAMEKLEGRWQEKKTTALLVGSYVDSYFEGSLDTFKAENPEIFKKTGDKGLRAEYIKAEDIIRRIESDNFFMMCLSGYKQVIMTGELFGAKWKIKIDSYIADKVIVDLKVMSSITKHEYVRDVGYLDFVRYWGYDIQGAIYQEIVRQNTGKRLPFYIAAASKEEETNIEVIHVTDNFLKDAMSMVEAAMPRILRVKNGEVKPDRCESCDCCRYTKVLRNPITILDLVKDI
ncbi:MAG: PD-(D/E)XK nuclease-like domain-containing protein [Lachnospiraceae bacterium]|nr:PD-(D/E)XK nuclease-like domain-containing protein [Acetatifactor aquisgranensis]